MDRQRVGALQAVRGRMRVVGGTTKSREEDEGKSDISLCPIERKMTGSLQKLTEYSFWNGIISVVFYVMTIFQWYFFEMDEFFMLWN